MTIVIIGDKCHNATNLICDKPYKATNVIRDIPDNVTNVISDKRNNLTKATNVISDKRHKRQCPLRRKELMTFVAYLVGSSSSMLSTLIVPRFQLTTRQKGLMVHL